MVEDDMVEVGGHHRARVDHRIAQRMRLVTRSRVDPHRGQAERGIGCLAPGQRAGHPPRVDGEELAWIGLASTDLDALERDAVAVGLELQVVADMHRRGQESDLLGKLLAQAADTLEQLAVLALVHHRNQAVADLEAEHVHLRDVVPARLQRIGLGLLHGRLGLGPCCRYLLGNALPAQPRERPEAGRNQQEDQVGHARDQAEHADDDGGQGHHRGVGEHLRNDQPTNVALVTDARHHQAGGHRDDQRRNLRHQPVADGEQGVGAPRLAHRHLVLHDADEEAAEDVDHQDDDAGNGVTAHELGGTVHRTIEVRLLGDLLAPALGLLFVDEAGVEIGVDRHLLAGHRIQGEARRHFRDTPRTLGDHHEVDDGEDHEHHQANRRIAAHQEAAEGLDHLACRVAATVAFEQHDAGGRYVQRQAQQGGDEQHRGEYREIQRALGVHRHQHHHHRDRDVEGEEHVEQEHRQRQHHHRQDHDDENWRGKLAQVGRSQQLAQIQDVVHGHQSGVHSPGTPGSMPAGTGSAAGTTGGRPPCLIQASSWYT